MDDGAEASGEGNSLTKAVHQGRLRLARLLLEGGAYINESNERGETPLMVACRSRHPDSQGASKARMVRYLLENRADPNIQDKAGKTALMHACLQRAGPEVAALLLDGGADLSLQDRAGCSALVHAIHAEDRDTLQVLLSACQARGKEVIIITTAKSPSGRHTTRQYLNTPPGAACTAPSQTDLRTAPETPAQPPEAERALLSFQDWQPSGDLGGPAPARGRSPPSLKHRHRVASLQEELLDEAAEEEPARRAPGLSRRFFSRHQSIDAKDAAQLPRTSCGDGHQQAPPPGADQPRPEGPAGRDTQPGQTVCASTPRSTVQRRDSGAGHYSSDSQLSAGLGPAALEDGTGKKTVPSPAPSLLSAPKDAPESTLPGPLGRRGPAAPERRGSGAFSAEHGVGPTRPGLLPPLHANPRPPVSHIGLLSCGQRVLVPTVPTFPKEFRSKKMLLRRQSLQTEQIKQLVNF